MTILPSRLQVRLAGIDASIAAVERRLANVEVVLAARIDDGDLTLAELAIVARARLISTLGVGGTSAASPAQEPLAGDLIMGDD